MPPGVCRARPGPSSDEARAQQADRRTGKQGASSATSGQQGRERRYDDKARRDRQPQAPHRLKTGLGEPWRARTQASSRYGNRDPNHDRSQRKRRRPPARGRLGVLRPPGIARPPLRRGGVQHGDDRLPGGPHRPFVPRSDRGDDPAAHRQLRCLPRGRGVRSALGRGFRRTRVHRGAVRAAATARWSTTCGGTTCPRSKASIRAPW